MYSSDTAAPPKALVDALRRPAQHEVTPIAAAELPQCTGCQVALKFYSDDADLPKNDPSQLLEYTLGARIALPVKNQNTDPPNTLDLRNVDFDVSYVNIAYLPAAMGPVRKRPSRLCRHAIRTSSPSTTALNKFLSDFPGWPRFVRTYSQTRRTEITDF